MTKYKNRSYIAMGVSMAGLAAAMILNLGFLRAVIGFAAALVFLIAGAVCQLIFLNNALAGVAGIDEGEDLDEYKRSVVRLGECSFGLSLFMLGAVLPLLFVGAYAGLEAGSWLAQGLLGAAFLTVIYVLACWGGTALLVKKGVLSMDGEAEARYWQNHRLQRKYGARLLVILAVTAWGQIAVKDMDMEMFAAKKVFTDYDSFVAYIEDTSGNSYSIIEEAVQVYEVKDQNELYIDGDGNILSADYVRSLEVSHGNALMDSDGNILCMYKWRNGAVVFIRYGNQENGYLPIVTYDEDSVSYAYDALRWINLAFIAVYLAEVTVTVILYRNKRAK